MCLLLSEMFVSALGSERYIAVNLPGIRMCVSLCVCLFYVCVRRLGSMGKALALDGVTLPLALRVCVFLFLAIPSLCGLACGAVILLSLSNCDAVGPSLLTCTHTAFPSHPPSAPMHVTSVWVMRVGVYVTCGLQLLTYSAWASACGCWYRKPRSANARASANGKVRAVSVRKAEDPTGRRDDDLDAYTHTHTERQEGDQQEDDPQHFV